MALTAKYSLAMPVRIQIPWVIANHAMIILGYDQYRVKHQHSEIGCNQVAHDLIVMHFDSVRDEGVWRYLCLI